MGSQFSDSSIYLTLRLSLTLKMKFVLPLFAALLALAVATPVTLELQERFDFSAIINIIKSLLCGGDDGGDDDIPTEEIPIDSRGFDFGMIIQMIKGFICNL